MVLKTKRTGVDIVKPRKHDPHWQVAYDTIFVHNIYIHIYTYTYICIYIYIYIISGLYYGSQWFPHSRSRRTLQTSFKQTHSQQLFNATHFIYSRYYGESLTRHNWFEPWVGEARFTLKTSLSAPIDAAIAMGPVTCTTTFYCCNKAKTVTLTTGFS